jgi:hypothetical protein
MARFERCRDRSRRLRRIGGPCDRAADDQYIGAVIEGGTRCGDALLVLDLRIGGSDTGNDGEEISRRRRLDGTYILWAADDAA